MCLSCCRTVFGSTHPGTLREMRAAADTGQAAERAGGAADDVFAVAAVLHDLACERCLEMHMSAQYLDLSRKENQSIGASGRLLVQRKCIKDTKEPTQLLLFGQALGLLPLHQVWS